MQMTLYYSTLLNSLIDYNDVLDSFEFSKYRIMLASDNERCISSFNPYIFYICFLMWFIAKAIQITFVIGVEYHVSSFSPVSRGKF